MTNYYPQIQHSRFLSDADRSVLTVADDANLTAFVKGKIILAIMIGYNGKDTLASAYKLQWRDVTDGGSFTGGGNNGGDVGAAGEVKYSASSAAMADGDAIAKAGMKCTNMDSTMTWQNGLCNVGDNLLPDSSTLDLGSDCYSELHWALDLTNADAGHQYEFRLWNNTSGATAGTCAAKVTTQSITPLTVADAAQAQAADNVMLPPPGVMDYYPESNRDNYHGLGTNNPYSHVGIGQSFTGDGKYASGAKFSLCKYGLPTGTAYFRIRAYSGTWANQDGVPTGGVLAEGTLDVATLDAYSTFALKEVAFAVPFQTVAGTHYVLTIEFTGIVADASNYVCVGIDASSSSHPGNESSLVGGTWAAESVDMDVIFYVLSSNNVGLAVADAAQAQAAESFALVQKFTLAQQDASQAQAADAFAIVQKFTLAGLADLDQGAAAEAALPLVQKIPLTAQDAAQTQGVEAFAVVQKHNIAAQDAAQPATIEAPALSHKYILAAQYLSQSQATDSPLLGRIFILAAFDCAQTQAVEGDVTVIEILATFNLAPDGLVQQQVAEALALRLLSDLAVQAASQAQSIEAPALVQGHLLAAQDEAQAQAADEAPLTMLGSLAVQGLSQGAAVDVGTIGQKHILTTSALAQAQAADDVKTNSFSNIAAQDAAQAQAAAAAPVTQRHVLAAADCVQPQSAGTVSLAQRHALAMVDISQDQGVDPAILAIIQQLQAADLAQGQAGDQVEVGQDVYVTGQDCLGPQDAGHVELTIGKTLVAQGLDQGQILDRIRYAVLSTLEMSVVGRMAAIHAGPDNGVVTARAGMPAITARTRMPAITARPVGSSIRVRR